MISRRLSHEFKFGVELKTKCDSVCGEEGTEGRCHDGNEAEDNEHAIAFPQGPILALFSTCIAVESSRSLPEDRWGHHSVVAQELSVSSQIDRTLTLR
jgi:hypothetical protein